MKRYMAKINIDDFTPKVTQSYFLDTNVWLLLYGDIANFQRREQAKYSKVLKTFIDRDCSIFLTSNIISEFSNVLLQKSFKEWKSKSENVGRRFKDDFVRTSVYADQVKLITTLVLKITKLPCVQRIPDDFNAVDLNLILEKFKIIDFNDAYIAEICKRKSLKLITNDRDFFSLENEIDIVSALA
jgi:predicted nucleic acid-binding protein